MGSFAFDLITWLAGKGVATVAKNTEDGGWGIYVGSRPGQIKSVVVVTMTPNPPDQEIPTTRKSFQVSVSSPSSGSSEAKLIEVHDLLHRQHGIELVPGEVVFHFGTMSGPFKIGVDDDDRVIWGANFDAFIRGQKP